jgi:hypothetical protein
MARRIKDARFPIGRPPTVDDVAAAVAFFAWKKRSTLLAKW